MTLSWSQRVRTQRVGKDKLTWDVTTQCQDEVDPEVLPDSKPRCNSCEAGISERPEEQLEQYAPSGGKRVPRIKRKAV